MISPVEIGVLVGAAVAFSVTVHEFARMRRALRDLDRYHRAPERGRW